MNELKIYSSLRQYSAYCLASGSTGYNRWVNNEMVRQYCIDNDKILFDFADLDCWSNGDQNTYAYDPGTELSRFPSKMRISMAMRLGIQPTPAVNKKDVYSGGLFLC